MLISYIQRLVDQAIKLVLQQRSTTASFRPGLTNQDLFYTQVTDIDAIVPALFAWEESCLRAPSDTQEERASLIISVGTTMMDGLFREALQYRQNHSAVYQPYLQGDQPEPEFVPWTGRYRMTDDRSLWSLKNSAFKTTHTCTHMNIQHTYTCTHMHMHVHAHICTYNTHAHNTHAHTIHTCMYNTHTCTYNTHMHVQHTHMTHVLFFLRLCKLPLGQVEPGAY